MSENVQRWLQEAVALHRSGRLDAAEAAYRRVLKKSPRDGRVFFLLGTLLAQQGRGVEAIPMLKKVIALNPRAADAYVNLGNVQNELGRPGEAEASYRKALSLNPRLDMAHCNLGIVLKERGNLDGAEKAYRKAIFLSAGNVEAHTNLGVLLKERGQLEEAEQAYRAALTVHPGHIGARLNLGNLLAERERYREAEACYRKVIEAAPHMPDAFYGLGNTYGDQYRYDEAIQCFRKAVEIRPDHVAAWYNLGETLQEKGELDAAEAAYRKALDLDPAHSGTNLNLLLLQQYLPNRKPEEILAIHREWGERVLARIPAKRQGGYRVEPDPDRLIRIGYLSPDFKRHQVAHFLDPVLANHDPEAVSVTCYANVKRPDDWTERMRGYGHCWRDVLGLDDAAVADRIREDRIDILVDLAGHTRDTRLTVLAYRPAPVQAVYLGYPCTTGLATVDYRFTDRWADPEGFERHYTEQLVRLETGFCTYRPYDEAPDIVPPPVEQEGHVTFGCLLPLIKINRETGRLWARALEAVPGSRLLVFRDVLKVEEVRKLYLACLTEGGIPEDRLDLVGEPPPSGSHLDVYNRIDVVLDAVPYGGHTTTCEALWMGVPVVTLAGDRFTGRMSASLLEMMGLPGFIAHKADEFGRVAAQAVEDRDRLRTLRMGMRERMRDSPLGNAKAVTRCLEAAYRDIWRRWCANAGGGRPR